AFTSYRSANIETVLIAMRLLNGTNLKEGPRVEDVVLKHLKELAVKVRLRIRFGDGDIASESTEFGRVVRIHGCEVVERRDGCAFASHFVVQGVVIDKIDLDVRVALSAGLVDGWRLFFGRLAWNGLSVRRGLSVALWSNLKLKRNNDGSNHYQHG